MLNHICCAHSIDEIQRKDCLLRQPESYDADSWHQMPNIVLWGIGMHIPSLLFEPLNSFIRLQKPQLGMVVYMHIRGSMGLQYHVHGNYSCTWTKCVV